MALARLFVGLDLALDDRYALATILEPLLPLPGRSVPPENWHVTLRFLGEADDVTQERLLAALSERIGGGPFAVRLAGLGAFPRPAKAAVLWMGLDDPEGRLPMLAASAQEAALDAGFGPEERPFHPHLTLSRIRPPADVWEWLEVEPELPRQVKVGSVVLFETRAGRGGVRYVVRERFPL